MKLTLLFFALWLALMARLVTAELPALRAGSRLTIGRIGANVNGALEPGQGTYLLVAGAPAPALTSRGATLGRLSCNTETTTCTAPLRVDGLAWQVCASAEGEQACIGQGGWVWLPVARRR